MSVNGEHRTVAVIAGEDGQATGEVLELLARCLADGDTIFLAGSDGGWRAATSTAGPAVAPGQDHRRGPRAGGGAVGAWRVVANGRLVRPPAVPGWAPVVIVLDGRAVAAGPWLAPLQAALADRGVGAAAPRTNIAGGDEVLVGVPYRPDEADVHRAFVEERSGDPTLTEASRLDGPCLAMRRADFESVRGPRILAGPAPVAELARRIAARGRRLVVAEGSYLHMAGGPAPRRAGDNGDRHEGGSAPLVTACLIVKNERENLPRCLESLEGFCDEVVVYDTGSSDRTADLARARGATVIEGYWDGDFSRARNAALAHCRGQWILWIDADEELRCDNRAAARRTLAEMPASAEALIVLIDNVRGTRASTSLAHPACRLFRRAYGHWTGRIHEQVRARAGSPELRTILAHHVRITHWGYLRSTVEQRAKGERNVRSAFSDLAGVAPLPWGARLVSLARSYGLRGQPEEAIDLCHAALSAADEPHVRRLAARTLVDSLLALGDPEAALEGVAALRRAQDAGAVDGAGCSVAVAVAEGRAYLALGQPERALSVFEQVSPGLDADGFEMGPHDLAADRARALGQLGRFGEAADTLLACIRATGGMDAPVGMLLECVEKAGRPLREVPAAVPAERQVAFLGQLVNTEPGLADRALEAWHEVAPSLAVLATAATVAPSLALPRRIVWSARLRDQGVLKACPLVATVADVTRPVAERLLAAALTVQLWADPRGRQAVTALVGMVPPAERSTVLAQVSTIAPTVAPVARAVAPTPGPLGGTSPNAAGGQRVLVVDRQPASLRSMALSVTLRRAGHRVTVSWPGSAPATEHRLAAHGIAVRIWDAQGAGDWQEAFRGDLARAAAEERYDTVVLAASALEMAATVRSLMPHAALVADLDDGPPEGADAVPLIDLVVTSGIAPPPAGKVSKPRVAVDASAGDLFRPPAPTPWELRQGAVVVGDFAVATDDEVERWRQIAPALDGHLANHPVVVVGHDPEGSFSSPLHGALILGVPADPVSWLRAARVAIVATAAGSRHWRGLAALAGTPVVCMPTGPDGRAAGSAEGAAAGSAGHVLAELAAAVGALVLTDVAPSPPLRIVPAASPTGGPAPDPLATLAGRRAARPAPDPATATMRVSWSPGSPLRDHVRSRIPAGGTIGGKPDGALLEIRGGVVPDLSPRRAARVAVELRWGYASLPVEWVGPLRDVADELWVPGRWMAKVLRASGIPSDAVHVVPPGIDVSRFAPERAPYELRTDRSVRLLFVGDCDEASGADALLEAYLTAFTDADDVCLVVRPTGPAERRTYEADLRRAAVGAPGRPAVEVVDPDLSAGDVAALYRACDVLVHPHRAAGSPEVVLEAMASGRPVITLADGAGADVCDQRTGWLAPCRTVPAPAPRGLLVAGELLALEPRRAGLAAALRQAAATPDRRLLKGLAARDRVVSHYSLEAAVACVSERISALCAASVTGAQRGSGEAGGLPPSVPAAG